MTEYNRRANDKADYDRVIKIGCIRRRLWALALGFRPIFSYLKPGVGSLKPINTMEFGHSLYYRTLKSFLVIWLQGLPWSGLVGAILLQFSTLSPQEQFEIIAKYLGARIIPNETLDSDDFDWHTTNAYLTV